MSHHDHLHEVARLLESAGEAHHDVEEEPGHDWSLWYARYLLDHGITAHIGYQPDLDRLAGWLRVADERYRASAPDTPWPQFYAEMIDEV